MFGISHKRYVDAVVTKAELIDHLRIEYVRLVQGEDLPAGLPCVTKARNIVALQVRLLPLISLDGIVAVQAVFVAEVVAHIARPLIDVDGCAGRTDESGSALVGIRNQRQQFQCRGTGRGVAQRALALGRGRHAGVQRQSLSLPQSLIAEEEKSMVLPDRAAEVGSKVVALEGRLRKVVSEIVGRLIEEVARVEHLVAQEIKPFAVPIVGPGAGRDMNDGSRVASVLGTVSGIVGFEFLDRIDGRLEGNLAVGHVVQVDTVDQEVDRVLPITRGIDGKGALSAQWSRQESVLRRGDGTRQE